MLTHEEQKKLFDYFFDYSISKSSFKKLNFRFDKLLAFVIQWRNETISKEDRLLENWLNEIAPSCVYIKKNIKGEGLFSCVICKTQPKEYKKAPFLIIHYKECHHELIPTDIFGVVEKFECSICEVSFVRKDYYNTHLKSKKHLTNTGNGESFFPNKTPRYIELE